MKRCIIWMAGKRPSRTRNKVGVKNREGTKLKRPKTRKKVDGAIDAAKKGAKRESPKEKLRT